MDARHFDTLTKSLSMANTRRGLLGLLATLPILGSRPCVRNARVCLGVCYPIQGQRSCAGRADVGRVTRVSHPDKRVV